MLEIGRKPQIHIELSDLLPVWKKFLKELHSNGILYCYATRKEIADAYTKVRKKSKRFS